MRTTYYVNINHSYFGAYIQDQWKVAPKFTINYGLRYDFEAGLSNYINSDYRGFQPRIGFASSPTKSTVIRSGFGIFDDHYNMTFFFVTSPQREVVIPNVSQPFVRKGNSSATYVLNQLSFDAPNPGNGGQPLSYPGLSSYAPRASELRVQQRDRPCQRQHARRQRWSLPGRILPTSAPVPAPDKIRTFRQGRMSPTAVEDWIPICGSPTPSKPACKSTSRSAEGWWSVPATFSSGPISRSGRRT